MPALPRDALAGAQRQQQVELLGEQLVVVVKVVAEERKRLGERAAAGHDLGAAAGEQVEGGEVLEDADWVVRAQHGDGAGQADALGAGGAGSQRHDGRGDREIWAVVLADAEDVEADLVGQLHLLDHIAQPLLGADPRTHVGEGVEAELDLPSLVARASIFRRR